MSLSTYGFLTRTLCGSNWTVLTLNHTPLEDQ